MIFDMSLKVAFGILAFGVVGTFIMAGAILLTVFVEEGRIQQEIKKAGTKLAQQIGRKG